MDDFMTPYNFFSADPGKVWEWCKEALALQDHGMLIRCSRAWCTMWLEDQGG